MLKRSKWLLSSTLGLLDLRGKLGVAKEEQDLLQRFFFGCEWLLSVYKKASSVDRPLYSDDIHFKRGLQELVHSQEKDNDDDTKGLFFRLHFLCGIYQHLYFS